MRRLFFLTPNKSSCQAIVAELEGNGVAERHLHVIASLEQPLDGLPEAGILQKTEVLRGMFVGAILGGSAGILGGLLITTFPPPGMEVQGSNMILAMSTLAGAGFGALVSALMSSHEHNHQLGSFQSAIEAGQILLMVDVPKKTVESTKKMILSHHPEASIGVARLPKNR